MKKVLFATIGLISTFNLSADDIASEVIHDYSFVGAGYSYLHDVANSGVNAHGGVGQVSYEHLNVVFSVGGGYFWADKDVDGLSDITLWNVTGNVGYVIRLVENHINIIPRFGAAYTEISGDVDGGGSATMDATTILPGVTLSYALCNRFSVNAGYTFGYELDDEEKAHVFTVGTSVALAERVGLNVLASFTEGSGFSGILGAISYHF